MIPVDRIPSQSHSSIRMDARLDSTTQAKEDDLAKHFHQPRAVVVCHILDWGLSYGQRGTLDGGESEGPVRHLSLEVDTALHARVEQAATAAGVKIAPWLRSMVRQITITDFPASWQVARSGGGSQIPIPMTHGSCCGWMRSHRRSFSNSCSSLVPR